MSLLALINLSVCFCSEYVVMANSTRNSLQFSRSDILLKIFVFNEF